MITLTLSLAFVITLLMIINVIVEYMLINLWVRLNNTEDIDVKSAKIGWMILYVIRWITVFMVLKTILN
jgi:hypothetical protein